MSDDSMQVSGAPSLLYTTIIVTLGTAVAFFILAVVLRRFFPKFFLRKIFITNNGRDKVRPDYDRSKGWLSWINYVIRYDEVTHLLPNHGGLETVLYLKFLKYCTILFGCLTLINTPLLMGLYTLGSNKNLSEGTNGYVMGLDVVTFSNLEAKSLVLIAPLIMTIVTTFVVWLYMWKYAAISSTLTIEDARKLRPNRSTVVIREVSVYLRTEEGLLSAMEKIHAEGNIHAVNLVPNVGKLTEMREEYDQVAGKLKIAMDYNEEKKESEPRMQASKKLCGPKMDAVELFTIGREEKKRDVLDTREKVLTQKERTPMAFAVFKRPAAAVMASQCVHRHRWDMSVSMAPDPEAIIWGNAYRSPQLRSVGAVISLALIIILFLFWPIPVAFLSGLMNLATLSKIPGFGFLVDFLGRSQWLTGIVQGILPTLALRLFMMFLVKILRGIHSLAFPISELSLDYHLMRSYWSFVLFNVFFVCVISGALYKSIGTILQNPIGIPSLLASSVPGVTTFFINYVLVGISGYYLTLSRAIELAIAILLKKLLSKTKAEKLKRDDPGTFSFVTQIGDETLVFSIALIYTTIGPLINVFTTMFFASAYFVGKHHAMYCNVMQYEGFKFVPITMDMIFASLVIFQVLMLALFLLKSFLAGFAIIPFIVMGFFFFLYLKMRYLKVVHQTPLDYLPADPLTDKEMAEAEGLYIDPSMTELEEYGPESELVDDESMPIDDDGLITGLTEMAEVVTPQHLKVSPLPSQV